jgi:hypothetical protein
MTRDAIIKRDATTERCIEECRDCHSTCVETTVHCLRMGGAHAEAGHISLIQDCAQSCEHSEEVMLHESIFKNRVCALCADVCDACADSCDTLLVAFAAGLLEFFPLVGPVGTALLLVSLVHGPTLLAALAFLVALRIVEDTTVYPRLIGRGMHLPAPAVLLAAWAGAWFGGVVGVLAAIPFVGVIAVAYRHWRDYRAIEQIVREHEQAAAVVVPPPPSTTAETGNATPDA